MHIFHSKEEKEEERGMEEKEGHEATRGGTKEEKDVERDDERKPGALL